MEICKKCGIVSPEWKVVDKVFANGTKHKELRCPECNQFFKYQPQHNDFELWFGKHKGKKVSELMTEDYGYLQWLLENSKEKLANRLQAVINKLK
jgi:hypothetical protein